MSTRTRTRRSYGYIRRLRSGRYQASYIGPDGQRHNAPDTFDTKGDADGWLSVQRTDISRGDWQRPAKEIRRVPTFAAYAESWLAGRQLRPRTRSEYRKTLNRHLLPRRGHGARRDHPAGGEGLGTWSWSTRRGLPPGRTPTRCYERS